MTEKNALRAKKIKMWVLVLGLLAVAGLGAVAWWLIQEKTALAARDTSVYQTTTVRRGHLSISITGTGNVVSTKTTDLGFTVSGTVGVLNVQVGDQVSKGQVLAVLDNLDDLQLAIKNQELAVARAQKEIDVLSNAELNLAQAYSDMVAAQTAYDEASKSVHYQGDSRCAPSLTQEYYFQWLYAQQHVDEWEGYLNDPNIGYGRSYILQTLAPLRKTRDRALANYKYCQSYTAQEIQDSQAALALAKANLDKATQDYATLQASGGIDTEAMAVAQAALENARLQLTRAQNNLAGATIIATMAGTVMAVNGEVGDRVGIGTFITLADLTDPELQVTIDESDLANFAVGCPVHITFNSMANRSFIGTVSAVSPSMVTSFNNVSKVEGTVKLDEGTLSGITLSPGLEAAIEVTCQQRNDVLLVASQALYRDGGKSAYVYVLNPQGQPEKHEVVVGLETVANAEIMSGLQEGEKVLLSQVKDQ